MISTDLVKELRDKTGISVMQCKKALEEAQGDVDKALVILRKHAVSAAAKKADREFGAGVVESYIHSNNEVGTIIKLSCETDFVSKNKEFIVLSRDIAMHATATNPTAITRDGIDASTVEAARSVFEKEAADKPESKRKQIIEGKMDSYFKEVVLLEQPFIKDASRTIKDLVEEAVQKFGEKIEITDFVRFSIR